MNQIIDTTAVPSKNKRNYKKYIIAVVGVALLTTGALYANSINTEAMSKAILIYKKEVLKSERETITEKIQTIDVQLGVANATDTGTVSK